MTDLGQKGRWPTLTIGLLAVALLVLGCDSIGSPPPAPTIPPFAYRDSVTLTLSPDADVVPSGAEMTRLADIVKARLAGLGISDAKIENQPESGLVTVSIPTGEISDMAFRVLRPSGKLELVALLGSSYGTAEQPGQSKIETNEPLPNSDFFPLLTHAEINSAERHASTAGPVVSLGISAAAQRNLNAYAAAHPLDFYALLLDDSVVAGGALGLDLYRAGSSVSVPISSYDLATLLAIFFGQAAYPYPVLVE